MTATNEDTKERRRAAGAYIAKLRVARDLSQLALANRLGFAYYTFISQVENGHARVPPKAISDWAAALEVDERSFAKTLLRCYEPETFVAIFGQSSESEADEESEAPLPVRPRDLVEITEELRLAIASASSSTLKDMTNRLYDMAVDDLLARHHQPEGARASRLEADSHLRNTIASLMMWHLDRRAAGKRS